MFADTDFILALLKDSDWLKRSAVTILEEHKGKIRTSVSVMIELALVCKRLKMNTLDVFANALEFIKVEENAYSICLKAALYIEKYKLNVFDSFHAAYCGNDDVISSDSVYERVGIKRLALERLS